MHQCLDERARMRFADFLCCFTCGADERHADARLRDIHHGEAEK